MLPDVEQNELAFDGQVLPWERRVREKPKAYAAFLVYRDLGPGRSLLKAYSTWKEKQGQGADPDDKTDSAPQNWRRWRAVYDWEERAIAWDALQQRTREEREANLQNEIWESRRQQKETLDKLRWERVLRMNGLIERTLQSAEDAGKSGPAALQKAKVEREDSVSGVTSTTEVDLLKQFEVLCEQERELVRDYFGLAAGETETDGPIVPSVVDAEFRWVPDDRLSSSETSATPRIPASTSSTDPPPVSKDFPDQ